MKVKFDRIAGGVATILMLIGAPGGQAILGYHVMVYIYNPFASICHAISYIYGENQLSGK